MTDQLPPTGYEPALPTSSGPLSGKEPGLSADVRVLEARRFLQLLLSQTSGTTLPGGRAHRVILLVLHMANLMPETAQSLIETLYSYDTHLRRTAADQTLKRRALLIDHLEKTMRDPSHLRQDVRGEAGELMSGLTFTPADPDTRQWPMRWAAAELMAVVGPAAFPALLRLHRHRSGVVRKVAAQALGQIAVRHDPAAEVIQSLIRLLRDSVPEVQDQALTSLQNIGQDATPYLLDALTDRNVQTRLGAIRVLAYAPTPAMREGATEALNDPHPTVRRLAARLLMSIASPDDVPALATRLYDRDIDVQYAVVAALREIDTRAARHAVIEWEARRAG